MAAPKRKKISKELRQAASLDWDELNHRITGCGRCARLRTYCQAIAREKRKAYQDWDYWGKPVPNFGDPKARLLIVGLAPAAHGANRTGRMFTGDKSGEWLYRALHKAGFANQSKAESMEDGLRLTDAAITATAHCAPPDNKPLPVEVANCERHLKDTLRAVPAQVFLALGGIAWKALITEFRARGWLPVKGPAPKFGHGALFEIEGGRWLLGSYHPSQQNTFTGRLTEVMLDDVFRAARRLLH